jgi:drug/metabolite transporter (DMT)-like permease
MAWIYYVLGAAVALAAGRIPDSLGMLLYGSVPFCAGLIWFLLNGRTAHPISISATGVLSGLGVGVMFSTVTFCMYAAFRSGAPISVASPLIRLGGLLFAALAGVLFWKEPLTARYLAGLALICSGMYLLLTK